MVALSYYLALAALTFHSDIYSYFDKTYALAGAILAPAIELPSASLSVRSTRRRRVTSHFALDL